MNQKTCRAVRRHTKTVKFCCQKHVNASKKIAKITRGGREALNSEQLCLFFKTLVWQCHAPWAVALLLLQLCLGDRCDCARQASTDWFSSLGKDDGLPEAKIPAVNGKTVARTIPLNPVFFQLLWSWISKKPLQSDKAQWPYEGQDLLGAISRKENRFLFCGRSGKGRNHPVWDKPISERAFLKQIQRAAEFLRRSRAKKECHAFADMDLSKIGTHSWKKSAVTLFKDNQISTSIVSVLTGTSCRTLDSVYDVPTAKRQRQTVDEIFTPVMQQVNNASKNMEQVAVKFCHNCSAKVDSSWAFCPYCAMKLRASRGVVLIVATASVHSSGH